MATAAKSHENAPRIDYNSLEQICQLRRGKSHYDIDHAKFMKEYPRIFLTTKVQKPSEERWRSLSAQPKRLSQLPQIVHENVTKLKIREEDSALTIRLKNIMAILQKHPPLRSQADIKKLGSLLSYFPALFGSSTTPLSPAVLEAIAYKAIMEQVRERGGMAFPREGGVYLVLQGTIRELDKEEGTACSYKTKILHPGDVFGEMKEPAYPQKHNYPVYMGCNRCAAMRISVSDFIRANQTVQEVLHQRHLRLIEDSTVLSKFPQNIQHKLAKQIKWKKVKPFTKLIREGRLIESVSIIKKGHCKAFMKVPDCEASVCVGEIGEHGCIGELYFDSPEASSPYSVVSTTHMVIAYIDTSDMDLDVRVARAPSQKVYSITVPSKSQLQEMYAVKLSSERWLAFKREVVGPIYHKTKAL